MDEKGTVHYLAFAPQADEPEKSKLLWNINVLGAYIKRRANLILMVQLFEDKRIRTAWDEEKEKWYFSCGGCSFHSY